MRVCVMLEGQQGVRWRDWVAVAETCERLGYEGLFRSDHYFSGDGPGGRGSTDAWTLLGALAARTERLRLGTLVSPVTFREPALLARCAATVDEVSGGRVEIGMGAGWWEEEHTQFGFAFHDVDGRWSRLEEQVAIVHGLLTEEPYSFQGNHYRLTSAVMQPRTPQRPRPPLILGGRTVGPRMQRLIARYADEFNTVGGTPAEVAARFARARSAVQRTDPPRELTTSLMTWMFVAKTEEGVDAALRRAHALDPSAGPFESYRNDIERDCIVGTPARAAVRLQEYADAGVERIFLNHELYDDLGMLELVATEVLPAISGASEERAR